MSVPPSDQNDAASGDARIGRAIRGSVVAWVTLGLCAGAVIWWFNRPAAKPPSQQTPLTAPAFANLSIQEIPEVKFTDITAQSGIHFTHENGAYGDKLLPETMGGGVAFFDFDSDGDEDLLFVNSAPWPWRPTADRKTATMALYRNDGKGRFDDVTTGSGLDVGFYGMGVAVGDYDNDGFSDVFITGVGGNRLFHNLGGGKFADATSTAGVADSTNDWSTSAAWIDFDNDGDLDLFVCHYVRWSKQIDLEVGYKIDGVTRGAHIPMT